MTLVDKVEENKLLSYPLTSSRVLWHASVCVHIVTEKENMPGSGGTLL